MGLRTQKRRRRECKTDYRLRLSLLKSDSPRIVIRRTNRFFTAQVVESLESQDKVVASVSSRDLLKHGWDAKFAGSLKSIAAGYLTGILLAKKLKKGNFIIDLGMTRTLAGNRAFAVVKGLIDGGLDISANEEVFPSEDRLSGESKSEEFKSMVAKVQSKLK